MTEVNIIVPRLLRLELFVRDVRDFLLGRWLSTSLALSFVGLAPLVITSLIMLHVAVEIENMEDGWIVYLISWK